MTRPDPYFSIIGRLSVIERYLDHHAQGRAVAYPLEDVQADHRRTLKRLAEYRPTSLEGCIHKLRQSQRFLAMPGSVHDEWELIARRRLRKVVEGMRALREPRHGRNLSELIEGLRAAGAAVPKDERGLSAVALRTAVDATLDMLNVSRGWQRLANRGR